MGILTGDIGAGKGYYANMEIGGGYNGMFMIETTLDYVVMSQNVSATDIEIDDLEFDTNLSVGSFNTGELIHLTDSMGDSLAYLYQDWGILAAYMHGNFEEPISSPSNWTFSFIGVDQDHNGTIEGTWNSNNNLIDGTVAGAWVDVDDALTGVYGGKVIGNFDPTQTTWQAVVAGTHMTSDKFLNMAATPAGQDALMKVNIPYIEVGETSLSYSNTRGAIRQVNMNDVKFFAFSDGSKPRLWATNNITGAVEGDPSGAAVQLSDGTNFNNSVTFRMKNWGGPGGNWDASVNGTGTVNTHNISIKGYAAGYIANTPNADKPVNFSGTGAGTAESQP